MIKLICLRFFLLTAQWRVRMYRIRTRQCLTIFLKDANCYVYVMKLPKNVYYVLPNLYKTLWLTLCHDFSIYVHLTCLLLQVSMFRSYLSINNPLFNATTGNSKLLKYSNMAIYFVNFFFTMWLKKNWFCQLPYCFCSV